MHLHWLPIWGGEWGVYNDVCMCVCMRLLLCTWDAKIVFTHASNGFLLSRGVRLWVWEYYLLTIYDVWIVFTHATTEGVYYLHNTHSVHPRICTWVHSIPKLHAAKTKGTWVTAPLTSFGFNNFSTNELWIHHSSFEGVLKVSWCLLGADVQVGGCGIIGIVEPNRLQFQ